MPPKAGKYIIDLFCGCGGVTQGFKKQGYTPILGIDAWEVPLKLHSKHHSGLHLVKKLGATASNKSNVSFNQDQLLEYILTIVRPEDKVHIHASPPCQQLSSMNATRSNSIRLTKWTLDFFTKLPKKWTWTLEQVDNIKIHVLLEKTKNIYFEPIDMSLHGVSQSRTRVIASNVDFFDELYKNEEIVPLKKVIKVPSNAKYIANGNQVVHPSVRLSCKNTTIFEVCDEERTDEKIIELLRSRGGEKAVCLEEDQLDYLRIEPETGDGSKKWWIILDLEYYFV